MSKIHQYDMYLICKCVGRPSMGTGGSEGVLLTLGELSVIKRFQSPSTDLLARCQVLIQNYGRKRRNLISMQQDGRS